MEAYVVIECKPGEPKRVARELGGLIGKDRVSIVSVDAVIRALGCDSKARRSRRRHDRNIRCQRDWTIEWNCSDANHDISLGSLTGVLDGSLQLGADRLLE